MAVQHKKVLIVDDDPTITAVLKQNIFNAGFEVETASSGAEAMEKFRTGLPDLVVLDALMPGMSGFEVSREIRVLDPGKKIPIIMLTGLKAESDAGQARAAGATEFITKPVDVKSLVNKIRSYLHSSLG